jgi:hypothetical protein
MAASPSPVVAQKRATVAGLAHWRADDDPELADARRELRTEALAEHIAKALDQAPPLTDEQRTRLAELLRPARQGKSVF